MKRTDVPQDKDSTYEGHVKLCYAVDENGRYVPVTTTGWDVEKAVKDVAWLAIERDLETVRAEVAAGRASALKYFMTARQMDAQLLALNMGMWTWRVKWHLRPRVFSRLSDEWVNRYADCLDVEAKRLREFRG